MFKMSSVMDAGYFYVPYLNLVDFPIMPMLANPDCFHPYAVLDTLDSECDYCGTMENKKQLREVDVGGGRCCYVCDECFDNMDLRKIARLIEVFKNKRKTTNINEVIIE